MDFYAFRGIRRLRFNHWFWFVEAIRIASRRLCPVHGGVSPQQNFIGTRRVILEKGYSYAGGAVMLNNFDLIVLEQD